MNRFPQKKPAQARSKRKKRSRMRWGMNFERKATRGNGWVGWSNGLVPVDRLPVAGNKGGPPNEPKKNSRKRGV